MSVANEQAWKDKERILRILEHSEGMVHEIKNAVERLTLDKQAILDDPVRKAELKKILDINLLHSLSSLNNRYNKSKDLYDWLETNNYF